MIITQAIRIDRNHVYIQWDAPPSTVILESSTSSSGPWVYITEARDFYIHEYDTQDRSETWFYRIRSGPETSEPVPIDYTKFEPAPTIGRDTTQRRPLFTAAYAKRWELQKYLRMHGESIYLLKRRLKGERCPYCYNQTLGKSFTEQCTFCLGTGYQMPYSEPLEVHADIQENPETRVNQVEHLETNKVLQITLLPYPLTRPGDVVIRPSINDFYEVVEFPTLENIKGNPVRQITLCARYQPAHVIRTLDYKPFTQLY